MRALLPLFLIAFLLGPAACPAAVAGEPGLWQYVHPESQFLAGIDCARARNSATGKMLLRKLAADPTAAAVAGPAAEALGMLDRVLISGAPAAGKDKVDVLVALEGRFDRAALRRLMPAGTAVERMKGYDVLVPPRSQRQDMLLALISDRLALAGQRADLQRVLGAPAPLKDTALVTRATLLAVENDVWLTSSMAPAAAVAALAPQARQFEEIESAELGVSLARGLNVNAHLTARTEKDAKALATFAQLGLAMVSQGKGQPAELASLLSGLSFKTDGRVVHIGFEVSLAQLEQGVSQIGSKLTASAAAPRAVPAAAVAPAPARQRTIRIVGAEGGDREIAYPANR